MKTVLRAATFGTVFTALLTPVGCAWQPGSRVSAAAIQKDAKRLGHREARKAMRGGKCEEAAKIYERANAYERFLQVAPDRDAERRDRIRGLISFYRQLSGLRVHQVEGAERADASFYLGSDRRPYLRVRLNGRDALFVIDTGSGFTVISREAAKRFGVHEIAKGGKSQGVGGTGKFPIVYGLIRSIDIGAVTVRMAPCFIRSFHGDAERATDERADGFIGLSILSRYLKEAGDTRSSGATVKRNEP